MSETIGYIILSVGVAFDLFGCIGLILLSKALGHAGIMKRDDYYDE